ncbi:MAG TPA: ATP-binding protein [Actinomycetota bacterium]
MDLLERASLLDELGAALGATATGGCVVLVAGEAGMGKSALVRRFAERHSADARFLLGACDRCSRPGRLGRCTTWGARPAAGWRPSWPPEARASSCSPGSWTSWTGGPARRWWWSRTPLGRRGHP